jgi:hypothetical protein
MDDLLIEPPSPLVPRHRRLDVEGRTILGRGGVAHGDVRVSRRTSIGAGPRLLGDAGRTLVAEPVA